MFGSIVPLPIPTGNLVNRIMLVVLKIVYIFGRGIRVNGMICHVPVVEMGLQVVDICVKLIFIEHAQLVPVVKLLYLLVLLYVV